MLRQMWKTSLTERSGFAFAAQGSYFVHLPSLSLLVSDAMFRFKSRPNVQSLNSVEIFTANLNSGHLNLVLLFDVADKPANGGF